MTHVILIAALQPLDFRGAGFPCSPDTRPENVHQALKHAGDGHFLSAENHSIP